MLRFLESFDHSTSPTRKWTTNNPAGGDSGFAYGIAVGRFGTNGGRHGNDSQQGLRKTLTAEDTWIMGCAFRRFTAGDTDIIFFLQDAGSTQIDLRVTTANRLAIVRGSSTTLETGTTEIVVGRWYFIELRVVIHNSAGEYEVRLDGLTELSDTGVDTQATGNASADQIGIGEYAAFNGTTSDFDDLYVFDGTDSGVAGAPNNDFIGDVRVQCRLPDGNGNTSNLVGSDGNSTDNYLLVDEASPDDDTTYVESSTPGDKDTYEYQDLSAASGTVYGVQILPLARKTDAGTRSIAAIARLGTTEVDSGDFALNSSYEYAVNPRDANPDGDQWTIADVNSAEFGVKVTA